MLTIAFTDGSIRPWDEDEAKKIFWHSSAHLMAEALESLYPGVKFWVGPAVDNGFYYDVDLCGQTISEDDFGKIEAKMLELAKSKETFERSEVSKADALKYFTEKGDQYKCDLISRLDDGNITFYTKVNTGHNLFFSAKYFTYIFKIKKSYLRNRHVNFTIQHMCKCRSGIARANISNFFQNIEIFAVYII